MTTETERWCQPPSSLLQYLCHTHASPPRRYSTGPLAAPGRAPTEKENEFAGEVSFSITMVWQTTIWCGDRVVLSPNEFENIVVWCKNLRCNDGPQTPPLGLRDGLARSLRDIHCPPLLSHLKCSFFHHLGCGDSQHPRHPKHASMLPAASFVGAKMLRRCACDPKVPTWQNKREFLQKGNMHVFEGKKKESNVLNAQNNETEALSSHV